MIDMFDGSNALEVCRDLEQQGLLHSAIPDPGSFVLGICSREEVSNVKAILSPVDSKTEEEKIIKGYLVDIVNKEEQNRGAGRGGATLALKLLTPDGQTTFTRDIEYE